MGIHTSIEYSTIVVTAISGNNLICSAECSIMDENSYYFNRLVTKPMYRNKGYAGKILDILLAIFKENDYELRLDINPYGDLNYL